MSEAKNQPTTLERQRAEGVDQLTALGEPSIPRLLEMLDDPSWTVRRAVVGALASLGTAAVAPLCRILREQRDSEARLAATVDALVASAGDADGPVIALASDPNPAVVADAAQILGRRRSARGLPTLIELTTHRDDNVTAIAIEAVGRIGGRSAIEALVVALQSGNFFRTFPAIDVLGRSGDPRAVPALASLLDDPHYAAEAIRALGRTGDRAAIGPLAGLLNRPGSNLVRLATIALADLHRRYEERYGVATPIDEALRRAAPVQQAVRRLAHTLYNSDVPEQEAICLLLGALGSEDAVPVLTSLLDAAPPVSRAAAEALGRLGRDADTQLLAALRAGDSARRALLLPLVTRASAAEDIIFCLADADAEVRALACDALGRVSNPAAVPALFPLLEDANPRVVQAAVGAIQSLGSAQTEGLALAAARSPSPAVRRAALNLLSFFGYASALPVFVEALRDPDPRIRDAAVFGLPFLDDPRALETLLGTARSEAERMRASSMRALGRAGRDPRVASTLLKGLSDGDPWVRYYACQSLGRIGLETAATAVSALLSDDAGQVRVAAIEALSHLRSEKAFQALQGAVKAVDRDVQRAALVGLGLSGRPEALPSLLDAARSDDAATRLVALSSMASFDSPEVLAVLARAATDADENVRGSAINFLAGSPGVEATLRLAELLGQPGSEHRVAAALATPTEGRIAGLLQALRTADDERALPIASSLARLRQPAADAALLDALRLSNPAARKAVASTLAARGSPTSTTVLKRLSEEDPDPEVRRICLLLLAQ